MALQITEEMRAKAEIYYGDENGREKTKVLLKEVGLPTGLLPLKNIIECGYHAETGFVWLKQKKKIEHKFEPIGKWVSYGTEVFAYAEKQKIKKLSGVKAKELLIWVTLSEISIDDNRRITFKTPSGLFKTFPASAFETEDDFVKETTKPIEEPKEVKESIEVAEAKLAAETNGVKETMEGKETKQVEEPKMVEKVMEA